MRSASESTYLQAHRQTLGELFAALGETMPPDDDQLVRWMEQRWLGAEHGPGAEKPTYPADALDQAWPLLQRLDLVDRVNPRGTEYDEVVVMGAAGIGLYRRLGLVRDSGVRAKQLTVLAGQRPHSGLARDGALDEYLEAESRFRAAEGWTVPAGLDRQRELLEKAGIEPLVAAQVVVPTETDMARLLLQRHWPAARLSSVVIEREPQTVINELGARTFIWEYFEGTSTLPSMRLLNSAPVQRRDGAGNELPARPTGRSSVREWLEPWGSDAPSSVLVVVNQPHLSRVANDVYSEMEAAAVAIPVVEVVGCEVLQASVDINLVLGEIPARINSERRASSSARA